MPLAPRSCIDRSVSIDERVEVGDREGGDRLRCAGAGECGIATGVGVGLKNISNWGS